MTTYTREARDFLDALADELEISDARYRDAVSVVRTFGADRGVN
jgi:hypothetical protein